MATVPSSCSNEEDVEDGEIEGVMLDTTILVSSVQQGQDISKNVGKIMGEIQGLVSAGDVHEFPELDTREACSQLTKAIQKTLSIQKFNLEQDTHRKPRRIIADLFTCIERLWQRACSKGKFGGKQDKESVAEVLLLAIKDGNIIFDPPQCELLTYMRSVLQKGTDSQSTQQTASHVPVGTNRKEASKPVPTQTSLQRSDSQTIRQNNSASSTARVLDERGVHAGHNLGLPNSKQGARVTALGPSLVQRSLQVAPTDSMQPAQTDGGDTETWDCVCVPCGYARILGLRAPLGSTPAQIRSQNAEADMIKIHLSGKKHVSNAAGKPADLCLEWMKHDRWLARKSNDQSLDPPKKKARVEKQPVGIHQEAIAKDNGRQFGPGQISAGRGTTISAVPSSRPGSFGNNTSLGDRAAALEEADAAPNSIDAGPLSPASADKAKRFDEVRKMLFKRKLCLVLDLDHTLLNSVKVTDLSPEEFESVKRISDQEANLPVSKRTLHFVPELNMWTKLRPGVQNFLDITSRLYNLHVYTMGTKTYAHLMASILDPDNKLFQGRIISRGDDAVVSEDNRSSHVKDFEGVMGMESAALVIDDTDQVWPNHPDNLITIERYVYFSASGRKLGHQGLSLIARECDESAESGQMAIILRLLANIHCRVFGALERSMGGSRWPPPRKTTYIRLPEPSGCWDVREILRAERKNILKNVKILFSRVFPLHVAPEDQPLWKLAESLGATCTKEMVPDVTHVVAESRVTDKAVWAEHQGKFLVTADWLRCCSVLWKRETETNFPVVSMQ